LQAGPDHGRTKLIGRDEKDKADYKKELGKIEKIIGAVEDLTPVFSEFLKQYRNLVRKNFEAEGAYFGTKWDSLSARYEAKKSKLRPGRKILQYNRTMIDAATGAKAQYSFEKVEPNKLEFGIKGLDYAKSHQYGYQPGRLPARPYLFTRNKTLPIQGMRVLRGLMESYIEEVIKTARARGLF